MMDGTPQGQAETSREDGVVIIDIDGDGTADAATIDVDGDGSADAAVINLGGSEIAIVNNDGTPEVVIVDLNEQDVPDSGESPGVIVINLDPEADGPGSEMVTEAEGPDPVEAAPAGTENPAPPETAADGYGTAGGDYPGMGIDGDHGIPAAGTGGYHEPGGESEPSSPEGAAPEEVQEEVEAQAHRESATEAQEHADAAIASGDYAAAAQEREAAENEAWAGGDSSMLHGSDSSQLSHAADDMKEAQQHEAQEAQYAEAGDYRAARDEAAAAAHDQSWSDFRAGGSDHTGQARAEYEKEDWAVWHQDHADSDRNEAEHYAREGEVDIAQQYSDRADAEQEKADTAGYEGQHGADGAVHDPSSDMAHDTPVDDHTIDVDTDYSADDGGAYDSGYETGSSGGYDSSSADTSTASSDPE